MIEVGTAHHAPEVVDDRVTGFIVASETEGASAARRLHLLDRARIRQVFEKRFTAQRMAEDYVALYRRLIAGAEPAGGDTLKRIRRDVMAV